MRTSRLFTVCVVALLVFGGCGRPTGPKDPEPIPVIYPEASCSDACDNAQALCGPSYLAPRTGTCAQSCQSLENNGMSFSRGCLRASTTCEAVKRCSR